MTTCNVVVVAFTCVQNKFTQQAACDTTADRMARSVLSCYMIHCTLRTFSVSFIKLVSLIKLRSLV